MKEYFEMLKQRVADNPSNYGDADSVLGLLYECFNENNPYDNEQIKADFEELYRQMNGMPLREMDKTSIQSASCAVTTNGLALWKGSRLVFGCERS